MTVAPGVSTPANEGRELWERLAAGDPTASADLALAYLEPLARCLRRRNPRIDPADCDTAAEEAILALSRKPTAYKPDRQTLDAYLQMSAAGDLKNILRAEQRHRARRADLEDVEHPPPTGKSLWDDDADPAIVVERGEEEAAMITTAAELRSEILRGLSTADARVLDLMQAGERRTIAYARVLGLDGRSLDEQKREVKKVKDRIKKRIERAGRGHAEPDR